MNEQKYYEFFNIIEIEKMPDLGAKVYNRLCVMEDSITGELHTFHQPVDVQEGHYWYNAYFEKGTVCVKMVINELLFCVVKFQ